MKKILFGRLMVPFLLACSATAGGTGQPSRALTVSQIENLYADLNDASSVLDTIDSGLFRSYQGKDRAAWREIYVARRAEVAAGLAKVSPEGLSPSDTRAVMLMKRALEALPKDSPTSMQPSGHCRDATQPKLDYVAIRRALYACFDEVGNNLEFEGGKVTRGSALDMLGSVEDPTRRKQLFLALTPLWQAINGRDESTSPYRRMMAMAAADAIKNGSPIDAAARTIGAQPGEVEHWLEQILDAWREVSGTQPVEPWDFRYQAEEADRSLMAAIPRDSLLPINQRYYHDLGADLKDLGVLYDFEARPGKAPLAYADFVTRGRLVNGVWQPSVVRVSANYANGSLGSLNELVHENGHAVHMAAIHTRPAFMDMGDDLFLEAFADVTSWDTYEPAWQQRYLGHAAPESASLRSLYSGVVMDVAWALFELRMLRNPASDPNTVWTEITSRYLHIVPHPEWSWWAVRVQLVDTPGYMVNYGLGSVLTADLRQHIQESLGRFETGNPEWYAWISKNLLSSGEEQETAALLQQFLGRPVSAQALQNQIRRIVVGGARRSP